MSINIAVVGATGNVGREMLSILASKKFDSKNIFPVASSRSEGSQVEFGEDQLTVESIEKFDPSKVQIVIGSDAEKTVNIPLSKLSKNDLLELKNILEKEYKPDHFK